MLGRKGNVFCGGRSQALTDFLAKQAMVERFLEVWIQVNDYRIANVEESVALAAAEAGAPVDQLRGQADNLEWYPSEQILADNESGLTYARFDALVDLFVELGRLEEKADATTFVNIDLYNQAMAALR